MNAPNCEALYSHFKYTIKDKKADKTEVIFFIYFGIKSFQYNYFVRYPSNLTSFHTILCCSHLKERNYVMHVMHVMHVNTNPGFVTVCQT